jgi:hypothetical protein
VTRARIIRGAGVEEDATSAPPPAYNSERHPMWVGPHSGTCGNQGRRVRAPPVLYPLRMPSDADLGIEQPHKEDGNDDPEKWPLYIKQGCINRCFDDEASLKHSSFIIAAVFR